MKKFISSVVFAAAMLTACDNIAPEIPEVPQEAVFEASTETAATKSSLSKNGEAYDVLWSEGDKIRVNGYELAIQTTDQPEGYGPGYTKANFAGQEPRKESVPPYYRAYFPASMLDYAVTGGWFLPARQTYAPGSIKDAPMYAASDDGSLSFKNLCGVIRLNLKGDRSITTISLTDRADSPKALSGRFTVSNNAAVVQGTDGVSLQCAESVDLSTDEATPFMISVPAGSYEKLQITILAEDGSSCKLTSKNPIVVERSLITDINISNPKFKNDNAIITYTTTGTQQINAYLNAGDDASKFGDRLTVVSHTYDAATQTGVIKLSGKATRFGYQAFFNKPSLKTISFPETITSVDEQAFYLCTNLESFDFSHITAIGVRAFQDAKLYNLVIPEHVQSIGSMAFNGIKSTTLEMKCAPSSMGSQIFASSALVSAVIDKKIDITESMFYNCRSLTSVTFKEGAESMGKAAFSTCVALEEFAISPITTIGDWPFSGCSKLKRVEFGEGLSSIGKSLFDGANAMESLTIRSATVPSLAAALKGRTPSIYVPANLVDAYKIATNWSTYADNIQAITE